MTAPGTPDGSPPRVVQLPVRDVTVADSPVRESTASVTRLPGSTPTPAPTGPAPKGNLAEPAGAGLQLSQPADAGVQVSQPAGADDDDAVLALVSARLGFQAATSAAGRVRLPSLADFLD